MVELSLFLSLILLKFLLYNNILKKVIISKNNEAKIIYQIYRMNYLKLFIQMGCLIGRKKKMRGAVK